MCIGLLVIHQFLSRPKANLFALRDWSLITGREEATKREGGAREVLPLQKGGAEQVLAMLKGGRKSFGVVFTR